MSLRTVRRQLKDHNIRSDHTKWYCRAINCKLTWRGLVNHSAYEHIQINVQAGVITGFICMPGDWCTNCTPKTLKIDRSQCVQHKICIPRQSCMHVLPEDADAVSATTGSLLQDRRQLSDLSMLQTPVNKVKIQISQHWNNNDLSLYLMVFKSYLSSQQ